MPFYEYQCSNCGYELEELQSISADPLVICPNCGKNTLKRLIGIGGGLIFKGSGFYLTDYKNNSKEASSKTSGKDSEKKETAATKETSAKETSISKKGSSKSSGKTTETKSTKKSDKKR